MRIPSSPSGTGSRTPPLERRGISTEQSSTEVPISHQRGGLAQSSIDVPAVGSSPAPSTFLYDADPMGNDDKAVQYDDVMAQDGGDLHGRVVGRGRV